MSKESKTWTVVQWDHSEGNKATKKETRIIAEHANVVGSDCDTLVFLGDNGIVAAFNYWDKFFVDGAVQGKGTKKDYTSWVVQTRKYERGQAVHTPIKVRADRAEVGKELCFFVDGALVAAFRNPDWTSFSEEPLAS